MAQAQVAASRTVRKRKSPKVHVRPPKVISRSTYWEYIPRIENDPNVPTTRLCHTATEIYGNRFILFGGWTGDEERSADVHIYSTDLDMWTLVECCGDIPCARSTHTMTAIDGGHRVILFGGYKGEAQRCNDLYVLEVDTLCWKRLDAQGTPPSERATHTASLVAGGTKLVIFGGRDETTYFNEVWILDIPTMTWKQIRTEEPAPEGRSGHSAVVIRDSSVLVFGGWAGGPSRFADLWELNTETGTWIEHQPSGEGPCHRSGHTAAMLNATEMLVFGGWGLTKYRHDVHILDITNFTWRRVYPAGNLPQKRRFHSMVVVAARAYVYGGRNHMETQDNSLWVLHFGPSSLLRVCTKYIAQHFSLYAPYIPSLSDNLRAKFVGCHDDYQAQDEEEQKKEQT